MLTVWFYYTNI